MSFLCVFDLETTGRSAQSDNIVQISLSKVHPFTLAVAESFTAYVRSPKPIPLETTKYTGISEQDLAHAHPFKDIAAACSLLLDDCVWVGHNIRAFDIPILIREYEAAKIALPKCRGVIDTLLIARNYAVSARPFVIDHKLESLARFFGVIGKTEKQPHSADGDVAITIEVLRRMCAGLFLENHNTPMPFAHPSTMRHDAVAVSGAYMATNTKRPSVSVTIPNTNGEEKKSAVPAPTSTTGTHSPLKLLVDQRAVFTDDPSHCAARTLAGNQCGNAPKAGSKLCTKHLSEVAVQHLNNLAHAPPTAPTPPNASSTAVVVDL